MSQFAPIMTTSNLQVVLQVTANKSFRGAVGDLKADVAQSEGKDPLYCIYCHGSMPALEEGQLAAIVPRCFDAPPIRRLTCVEFVQKELNS